MEKIFNSKLFKFIVPLFAYLLFAFVWLYNILFVWKSNQPEETRYFTENLNLGFYLVYAYVFLATFAIFLTFGIMKLVRIKVSNLINNILIIDLIISIAYIYHYFSKVKTFSNVGIIIFFILLLLTFSIFKFDRR